LVSFIFGIKLHQSMSRNPNMTHSYRLRPLQHHPPPSPTRPISFPQCAGRQKSRESVRLII
jgi:hypothetical protein